MSGEPVMNDVAYLGAGLVLLAIAGCLEAVQQWWERRRGQR